MAPLSPSATPLARLATRRRAAASDLLLPADARLPERVRFAAERLVAARIDAVERDLRQRLGASGRTVARDAIVGAGLLDEEVAGEAIAAARADWLEERLAVAPAEPGGAGLIARLLARPGTAVADAARAYVVARSRAAAEQGVVLPADSLRRVTWLVAASLRRDAAGQVPDVDLVAAVEASLLAAEDAGSVTYAAERLVAALEGDPAGVGSLLLNALRERSVPLFAALLAGAARIAYDQARMVLLEPAEPLFLVALRAAGLDRQDVARVAAALAEAEQADLDEVAEALDDAAELTMAEVDELLAPLRLPHGLRAAVAVLERGR